MKVINTQQADEDKIINTGFKEPERQDTRKVLRLTKVNSVDKIQTKAIQDGNYGNITNRSVNSVERRTTPNLYLPYLLGNKDNITPVFNMATHGGFRTQQERKCLAFTRTLQRDHKELFSGIRKEKRSTVVINISRPVQINSRCAIIYPRNGR